MTRWPEPPEPKPVDVIPGQLDLYDVLAATCIYCGKPTDDGSDEHESCWQKSAAAAVEPEPPEEGP